MISTLTALLLVFSSGANASNDVRPQWYQHLAKTKGVAAAPEKRMQVQTSIVKPFENAGGTTIDGRPLPWGRPFSKEDGERWEIIVSTQERLRTMLRQDQVQEAFEYLTSVCSQRPDVALSLRIERAQMFLLTDRNKEGYELLLQIEPRQQFEYLLLAYASAAAGETYPGQAQYCADAYLEHFEIKYTSPPVEPVVYDDPKKVMSLAMLALGMRHTISEPVAFRKALEADPLNYQAADELIEYYECKGRYDLAYEVAAKQLALLPDGVEKTRLNKRFNVLRECLGK